MSGTSIIDEYKKAQEIWKQEMSRIKGKTHKSDFNSFACYASVEDFQAFQDIPSHIERHEATSTGGHEGMTTQSSEHDSPINLAQDVDEVPPNLNVRPIGRKTAKEAN
ncbi:PREDICTED: uncharacterized protein LOC101307499 [Fragaria vesca subsp. vesca]|uniref:uncharacterized protein LOC101307499 n=1 Tax=Fragaria vesca subsp. vesca TaxID=101020 RepID=UPI0002C3585C|nr:PREDICTED: uncharacterized protein LOC101307499 [Fragaria vesca subsp. vesca]